jgi:hypothetical protein
LIFPCITSFFYEEFDAVSGIGVAYKRLAKVLRILLQRLILWALTGAYWVVFSELGGRAGIIKRERYE